jgi:methylase of polypeptide subunit release factors
MTADAGEPLVAEARRGPLVRVYRKAVAVRHRLTGRHRGTQIEIVRGVPLIVLPEVFNPVLFLSGALLADAVATSPAVGRVLDLGTGSGVGAVFSAFAGARVVAVDVNPEAVRCVELNASMHRVSHLIAAREGDLFAPVVGERFDRVLFNPPFFRGEPTSARDRAWRSVDVLERFAAGLEGALAPRGQALVVLSTDGACRELLALLRCGGHPVRIALRRRFFGEIETVYAVDPRPTRPDSG